MPCVGCRDDAFALTGDTLEDEGSGFVAIAPLRGVFFFFFAMLVAIVLERGVEEVGRNGRGGRNGRNGI